MAYKGKKTQDNLSLPIYKKKSKDGKTTYYGGFLSVELLEKIYKDSKSNGVRFTLFTTKNSKEDKDEEKPWFTCILEAAKPPANKTEKNTKKPDDDDDI